MFKLEKENFVLSINSIVSFSQDVKNHLPINGFMFVDVISENYKAISQLDIDINELQLFFNSIIQMWKNLSVQKVTLQEKYGYEQYISFEFDNKNFIISGMLCDTKFGNFKLTFNEKLDQSYLNSFIQQLKTFDINNFIV